VSEVLPHDLAGWITLIIALLSAFLSWMTRRQVNGPSSASGSSTNRR